MRHALDPSVPPAQSEQLSRWLLLEDSVLLYQAALTLGKDGLKELDLRGWDGVPVASIVRDFKRRKL